MGYKDISHLKLQSDLKFKECVGNSSNIPVNSRKMSKFPKEKNNGHEEYVRTKNNDNDDVADRAHVKANKSVRFDLSRGEDVCTSGSTSRRCTATS